MLTAALDSVSGDQKFAGTLAETAIVNPGSVDEHDIFTAQAKAAMSLEMARNIINRLTQSWQSIIRMN
jgi:flagellar hook-basal body complex protein FliE